MFNTTLSRNCYLISGFNASGKWENIFANKYRDRVKWNREEIGKVQNNIFVYFDCWNVKLYWHIFYYFRFIENLVLSFSVFCTTIFPKKQNPGSRADAKKIFRKGRTYHALFHNNNNNTHKLMSLHKQK